MISQPIACVPDPWVAANTKRAFPSDSSPVISRNQLVLSERRAAPEQPRKMECENDNTTNETFSLEDHKLS